MEFICSSVPPSKVKSMSYITFLDMACLSHFADRYVICNKTQQPFLSCITHPIDDSNHGLIGGPALEKLYTFGPYCDF